jgi:hypothetical protein
MTNYTDYLFYHYPLLGMRVGSQIPTLRIALYIAKGENKFSRIRIPINRLNLCKECPTHSLKLHIVLFRVFFREAQQQT